MNGALLLAALALPPADRLELVQTLSPGFPACAHRLVDLDAAAELPERGARELVVLGTAGEVRVFAAAASGGALKLIADPRPAAKLADPSRALVDFARLRPGAGLDLVVLGPRDTRVHAREGAWFAPEGVVLARRASHGLRVGAPRFVDVVQDVNGDGQPDLVVPAADALRLWLAGPPAEAGGAEGAAGGPWPTYVPAATLAAQVGRDADRDGDELSDVLSASFRIPSIVATDVNGDARADLLVSHGSVRAFHLQAPDATFPQAPSVKVDLAIFRDTIEKAEIKPGHTLAIGDQATYESRDLDGDGIPDYVIGHRRKVWVFHGSAKGPQFTQPTRILKVREDITALQVMQLNDDRLPDLLVVKVQVPTIATLVRGVFGEWDVEIAASGYLSKDGRSFEEHPSKQAVLAVRLPAILRLLKNPASFLQRFDAIGARFRRSVWGDLDGDGARDVLLASEDGRQLELWLSDGAADTRSLDGEELLAKLLFEDEQRVWDIDRIAGWLGGVAEQRTALLTGGKPSIAQFKLRPASEARLVDLEAADLDGDGREELVLCYAAVPGGARTFDVLRLAK